MGRQYCCFFDVAACCQLLLPPVQIASIVGRLASPEKAHRRRARPARPRRVCVFLLLGLRFYVCASMCSPNSTALLLRTDVSGLSNAITPVS